jgi:uncharacterized BrkB/YihY/UPF0761 family membrane protein
MIQRKQTLFLLVTVLLTIASAFVPWGYQAIKDALEQVKQNGLTTLNTPLISIAVAAVLVISCLAIFLYKNRGVQKKIILLSILAIFAWLLSIVYTKYNQGAECIFHLGVALPALALILNSLAWKGVNADDRLVKSIDRFRD